MALSVRQRQLHAGAFNTKPVARPKTAYGQGVGQDSDAARRQREAQGPGLSMTLSMSLRSCSFRVARSLEGHSGRSSLRGCAEHVPGRLCRDLTENAMLIAASQCDGGPSRDLRDHTHTHTHTMFPCGGRGGRESGRVGEEWDISGGSFSFDL